MSLRALACLAILIGSFQAPTQQPARERRQLEAGTGHIRGRVVSAVTGAPLRGAEITLSASEPRVHKLTSTDLNGRYEFSDLPAAHYNLIARKPGFVALRFGAKGPLDRGTPIELLAAQTRAGVDLSLPRGSVIAGEVVDEFGEPILNATVRAMRYQSFGGQRRLVAASGSRLTDDAGRYRIFGLLPGSYYVSAVAPAPGAKEAEADKAPDEANGYAPTYYPGTSDVARAQRVTVALGEELPNISFLLNPTRTARISGMVTDSKSQPLTGAKILLTRHEGALGFRASYEGHPKPDGGFEISNVPPGTYVLQIRATTIGTSNDPEFASVPVVVAGRDVTDLILQTSKGSTAHGRVMFEGSQRPTFQPSTMEVAARPASFDDVSVVGSASRVKRDWTFELKNLAGSVLIRTPQIPSPWALKAILNGGEDVTDTAVEVKVGQEITGLRVVLTTDTTEISGRVSGCREMPGEQCSVLVFADDTSRWGPQTRFVRVIRPDRDGAFKIRGLPPGAYLAAAIQYVWQGEWYDPDFLEQVRPSATRLSLTERQTNTLNLKAAAVP